MAKVILITTREFERLLSNGFEEIIIPNTCNIEDEGVQAPEQSTYLGLFFSSEWCLTTSIMADPFLNHLVEDNKLPEVINKAIESKGIQRRCGGFFKYGIWRKKFSDNEFIYLADEYPFSNDEKGGFNYLNAIVGEIVNDVNKDKDCLIKEIVWTIVSHDGDWGIEKNSMIIKEKGQTDFDEIVKIESLKKDNMPVNLKSIVEKEDSEIIVFQHSPSSDWYCYVQLAGEMTSIEDTETFVKKAKEQKAKVKQLLEKEDFNPAEFANLGIDPRYPFLSFEIH